MALIMLVQIHSLGVRSSKSHLRSPILRFSFSSPCPHLFLAGDAGDRGTSNDTAYAVVWPFSLDYSALFRTSNLFLTSTPVSPANSHLTQLHYDDVDNVILAVSVRRISSERSERFLLLVLMLLNVCS